jgi:hypothetical protein
MDILNNLYSTVISQPSKRHVHEIYQNIKHLKFFRLFVNIFIVLYFKANIFE